MSNSNWGSMSNSVGTDDWGMVDHMVSSMGGDMLLDGNLGNMVHLVVNLNTNLVDDRSGSNSNWGSMSNSNWGSMSNSNWGSVSNSNWGSLSNSNGSSMSNSN